jgi:hypothetical protein
MLFGGFFRDKAGCTKFNSGGGWREAVGTGLLVIFKEVPGKRRKVSPAASKLSGTGTL